MDKENFLDWFHWSEKGEGKNPVKIQGDSYSFDIAESEYDNQIAPIIHQC